MLDMFSIHQINAPKIFLLSLKTFIAEKEAMGYAKVIHKKRVEKNGQVSKISKTMGTQMPA